MCPSQQREKCNTVSAAWWFSHCTKVKCEMKRSQVFRWQRKQRNMQQQQQQQCGKHVKTEAAAPCYKYNKSLTEATAACCTHTTAQMHTNIHTCTWTYMHCCVSVNSAHFPSSLHSWVHSITHTHTHRRSSHWPTSVQSTQVFVSFCWLGSKMINCNLQLFFLSFSVLFLSLLHTIILSLSNLLQFKDI